MDDKPWLGEKTDHRRLMDLVNLWYSLYGRTLSKGKYIHNKFVHMVNAMGNPVASSFTAKLYADFRSKRMAGELDFIDRKWQKGAPSIATLNSELARFKAVFSKLKELGEWKGPNPLEDVKLFKDHEREMAFLPKEKIPLLLDLVGQHEREDMLRIVKICLATLAQDGTRQLNCVVASSVNTKSLIPIPKPRKIALCQFLRVFTMNSINQHRESYL